MCIKKNWEQEFMIPKIVRGIIRHIVTPERK